MIDYDRVAADYARLRQVHPGVLRGLLTEGGLERASKVLEVGCGTGNYIGAIAQQVGCRSYGIDPSERMLGEARGKVGVRVRLGRGEKLEFRSTFFDLVFTVDVVHHLGDRMAYFREAYRVTKPWQDMHRHRLRVDHTSSQAPFFLLPRDRGEGAGEISLNLRAEGARGE